MSKLYPPILESSLPAFILNEQYVSTTISEEEFNSSNHLYYIFNSMTETYEITESYSSNLYLRTFGTLTIPFAMNKAVSIAEVYGFKLIIKSLTQSKIINDNTIDLLKWDKDNNILTVDLIASKSFSDSLGFNYNQYYKVQLAYIDIEGNIGHYSSVSTIKATYAPTLLIENLNIEQLNIISDSFTGIYTSQDISEKVYYYTFNIYDKHHHLYSSSGQQLHNSSYDEIINNKIQSFDSWTLNKPLLFNEQYTIEYVVTTINNLIVATSEYPLMTRDSVDIGFNISINGKVNNDNGYIEISLVNNKDEYISGTFVLSRACSKNNYGTWEKLLDFKLKKQAPFSLSWKDFTIEHGYSYIYGLQQININNLYSNRMISQPVQAAFEDSFLYDGQRQLKIRFNPKVSSFKNTLLETKTDTIGNKYPFFFRNGNVSYKEFPISGLISYHSDNEELFITQEELSIIDNNNTDYGINLTSDNILAEQIFKMKVLDFLNNGETKLFKSPSEGNYLVRLMNISFSPNDTVGRMLHTFSSTAYEIKEYNYQNLINDKFLHFNDVPYDNKRYTINFAEYPADANSDLLSEGRAAAILLEGMVPGATFNITLSSQAKQTITIGPSGKYYLENLNNVYIVSLSSTEDLNSGILTYYVVAEEIEDNFNNVISVSYSQPILQQAFGPIDLAKQYNHMTNNDYKHKWLYNNLKQQPLCFHYIKLYRRQDPIDVYYKDGQYFYTYTNELIATQTFNKSALYRVGKSSYRDGSPKDSNIISGGNNMTAIINGAVIDVSSEVYELYPQEPIYQLELGSGVACDYIYSQKEIEYLYDKNNPNDWIEIQLMYANWQQDLVANGVSNLEQLYLESYFNYLTKLKKSVGW